jgi:hypothetical protein
MQVTKIEHLYLEGLCSNSWRLELSSIATWNHWWHTCSCNQKPPALDQSVTSCPSTRGHNLKQGCQLYIY